MWLVVQAYQLFSPHRNLYNPQLYSLAKILNKKREQTVDRGNSLTIEQITPIISWVVWPLHPNQAVDGATSYVGHVFIVVWSIYYN